MSSLIENIRIALVALQINKLRAALTTLGIGIGIAAVVILLTLGQAAQGYINRQFLSTGANIVTINSSNAGGFGGRGDAANVKLGMRDVSALENPNNITGVESAIPELNARGTTRYGANTANTQVTGTDYQYFNVENRTVDAGRLFTANDQLLESRVAVLGSTTVQTLFNDQNAIGQTILIHNIPFTVIGTLATVGSTGLGANQDDIIIIPITTAQHKLSSGHNIYGDLPVSTILLKVSDPSLIPEVSTSVATTLRQTHRLKPTDDNDFTVSNAQDTLDRLSSTIGTLTALLAVIGGISLLVGGIGVMNIMLVTVTERTREIGLRKAVGAKFRDILSQFLTEAIVLCFVGGVAGLVLSYFVVSILGSAVASLDPVISPASVVLSVGVVTLVGVFFGLYPASRAAALSPIKALRTE